MIRQRLLFEPRLLKSDEDDTIISYTHIDDQFHTTVGVHNISKGRDIAQIKGAQVILSELAPAVGALESASSKNYLILADPVMSKAVQDANPRSFYKDAIEANHDKYQGILREHQCSLDLSS